MATAGSHANKANGSHTPDVFVVGIRNFAFEDTDPAEYQNGNGTIPSAAQDTKKTKPSSHLPRKDHGYTWVILFSSIAARIIQGNGQAIMGILILELKDTFDASTAQLVAASTTQVGISMSACIFTSLCIPVFGVRPTVITGALIAAVGYLATSFATSTLVFFITYGVVAALGTSFLVTGFLVNIPMYFERHSAFALGLFVCSFNIGNFLWPPLVTTLFSYYGWRGSFMIMAGIQLNMCVLGALQRPFLNPRFKKEDRTETTKSKSAARKSFGSLWQLFKNGQFMLLNFIMLTGFMTFSFGPAYLPTLAEGIGASSTDGALLVSIHGTATFLSGMFHGFLGDRRWFCNNRPIFLIYAFVVAAGSKMYFVGSTTYWQLALFAVLDGISLGGYTAPGIAIALDVVSLEQKPIAPGLNAAFIGMAMLFGSVSSGWLLEYFGGLTYPALILGGIQLFAALLMCFLYVLIKRGKKNTAEYEVEVTQL